MGLGMVAAQCPARGWLSVAAVVRWEERLPSLLAPEPGLLGCGPAELPW